LNLQDYIDSGVLELYASGLLNEQEMQEVDRLVARYPELEKELEDFYTMREEVIKNSAKDSSLKRLLKTARELAVQSEEIRAIIGNELKQLSRILKIEITL